MIIVAAIAGLLLAQTGQSITCANLVDQTTAFRFNGHDVKAALRVHAADDHLRDTHLCQTDCSLVIWHGDRASSKLEVESIDDSWGREVDFRIDGYSLQGRRLIASIVERGNHPVFHVAVYSLDSDKVEIYEVPQKFIGQLPAACGKSFGAVGMTRLGEPVVGFRNGACDGVTTAWSLKQGPMRNGVQAPARPIRLSDRSMMESIEAGEAVSSE